VFEVSLLIIRLVGSVIETLDSPEILRENQVWLDYLWDFKTRGINLDSPSIISSSGLDMD